MASVPNPEKPGVWSGGQPQHAEDYGVAEEPPHPAAEPVGGSAGGQRTNWWYVPRATGKREGPVPLDGLKQRLAAGSISPDDLVWRDGMAEWLPARTVPELSGPRPSPGGPPPFPTAPVSPTKSSAPGPSPADYLKQAQDLLARPAFYRIVGWACGGLCLLTLALSMVFWLFGHTWFDRALVFGLVFFVGEATAAILERLDRIGPLDKR